MKKNLHLLSTAIFIFWAGMANAQTPGDWSYAVNAGGNNNDIARAIATDAAGNSYVAGNFDLTATFYGTPNITLTTTGANDIFVAKYNTSGSVQWAVKAGGKLADGCTGISIDNNGNSYITGSFMDTATFYGSSNVQLISNGGTDIFVAKYDPSGNIVWAVKAGGLLNENGSKIKVDGTGNTFVTGTFANDTCVFYGAVNDSLFSNGQNDVFIAMFDPNGVELWATNEGGNGNDNGYGIAIDGAGNCYVAGTFLNKAYFYTATGMDSLTAIGSNDIFVGKFDINGDEVWVRQGGSNLTDQAQNVALDGAGNVYVTGNLNTGCTFFAPPANIVVSSNGSSDIFIASYTSTGDLRWANHAGSALADFSSAININASNHCSITGAMGQGGATFYGTPNVVLTSNGSSDIFVVEYDTAGNALCGQSGGGTGFDRGWDISSDAAGNSYVAGQFTATATFQSTPTITLTTSGGSNSDAFIGKWLSSCSGTTGISVVNNTSILIFPNPATGIITLSSSQELGSVTLCNYLGEIVLQTKSKNTSEQIDLKKLPAGVYTVRVQDRITKVIKE